MRRKKNREVNIYSASVVDLFASGLGVFLIVSIIALANQKKESSKAKADDKSNPVIAELMEKVETLSGSLSKKTEENIKLRLAKVEKKMNQNSYSKFKGKLENEAMKTDFLIQQQQNKMELEVLKTELNRSKLLISELSTVISSLKASMKKGEKGKGSDYHAYEIGSKFKLEDVHFYPGTDRPIEPYASMEIKKLSEFLKNKPTISIEVSGHIYQSKKSIEKHRDSDDFNLSGKRANVVCDKLAEFGINDSRLRCVGYAAKRYLYLTDDQYSKEAQLNRRVEVEILSK
jgi:outer membrane protein OmpA-like peptidoglycan-associated protein